MLNVIGEGKKGVETGLQHKLLPYLLLALVDASNVRLALHIDDVIPAKCIYLRRHDAIQQNGGKIQNSHGPADMRR